ncbi:put4 Probable proline-specific permease put4 [Candida maltosa Xu316]|uniref:Proline specific permease n=1 Tax=Candida maltosa (strain Xu316) TaxID=1245528 RepID=M3JCR0_CANMX|nr:Proline specific permease [Candida maltosa Xu316]
MGLKDLANIKVGGAGTKHIYRGSTASLNLAISNSRIVEVDEKGERILSRENSNESATTFQPETLERGLKSRHSQLIALGGAIGTGLFVGSGIALTTCGPASLFLSYLIMASVVYFVLQILSEMTVFLPLPGNGPIAFINDYLSPSFGFAMGYNYWYAFSILVAAEVTAAAIVIEYWTKSVPTAVWITILLAFIIITNFLAVQVFGEVEFCVAFIKLICLTGLIILGVVIFFGGAPTHDRLGFRYWKHSPFKTHLVGGSTGRFLGFWTALIKSGFAYITSPELISTTMGETINPRANGKKAARRFIYRLIFFYALGTLVIGVIVSANDPKLLGGGSDASGSPFVIGIQNAGIPVLNHIINAVILTSATSAGNSFLYSSSRALYSMAQRGKAPKIFAKVNRFGVPYYSVGVSSLFGFLAYLNVSSSAANVFNWFSNLSTISGFLGWLFISFAYLRWRKAIAYNGLSDRVPYKTMFQPYGTYFVIFLMIIIIITNGYAVFFDFKIGDFLAAYITLPIVLVLYAGHRIYTMIQKKDTPWLIPIEEIDLITGLDLVEEEELNFPPRVPKNFLQRIWFWVA